MARSRVERHRKVQTSLACLLSAVAAAGATALAASQGAFAAGGRVVIEPGTSTVIAGYGYSCQDTIRTPNWGCSYGPIDGPEGTPIMTVFKGQRTMTIESLQRPTVQHQAGEYLTTVRR